MSGQPSLPRLFGPYVLTRLLGSDPFGEVYRAGTAAGKGMRPFLLIRIFNGEAIDRDALFPAMETAVDFLEEIKGPSVAKGAVLGTVEDTPFAGIEYVPGRTLDKILSSGAQGPVPIPPEHALLVTEKILIALEAAKPLSKGTGAPHGFMVPGFVSVSNDGDTRIFGAGLGPGLLMSLKSESARAAFLPYIAPEVLASAKPSVAGDIYSAASILFETLTGKPPAHGSGDSSLNGAVLALNGNPVPDDIKSLLTHGLASDPARRASDVVGYRKELGKLLYGGPYAPSTFNLAFFMHHQFEKAIETERKELNAEEQIDPKALIAQEEAAAKAEDARLSPAPAPRPKPAEVAIPKFGLRTESGVFSHTLGGTPVLKKSGMSGYAVPIVAGVVTIAIGGGIFFLVKKPRPVAVVAAAVTPTAVPAPTVVPTPLPQPTPAMAGKEDPAFQAALAAKLQEEDKKILDRQKKGLDASAKKKQVELDKAADESRLAREKDEAAKSARDRADQEEAGRLAQEAQDARLREDVARKAAQAALPVTKEGDFVDVSLVDMAPVAAKVVKPDPTSMALQRHISGTVLLQVLVDENGRAAKIEVLRDTNPKVGLGEACKAALKQWEWTPAMKDGKRVKTTIAVPIPFKI